MNSDGLRKSITAIRFRIHRLTTHIELQNVIIIPSVRPATATSWLVMSCNYCFTMFRPLFVILLKSIRRRSNKKKFRISNCI